VTPYRFSVVLCVAIAISIAGCDRSSAPEAPPTLPDEPSPAFRNVDAPTAYVGDEACVSCHTSEASAYRQHDMSRSFHRWTPAARVERPLDSALYHEPTGFQYSIVEDGEHLYQVEFLVGPGGKRLHELRRRIDYVMGSGAVARTYFTEENGRLFQLPLTWYRQHGWDFSPGYELNNARFDRLLPDRCIACHSSYPRPLPFLEGKYAELPPGIGCERCHGPGALHVEQRRPDTSRADAQRDTAFDNTIVNPARLPLARRLDVCEQCHVHTPVTVLRDGKDAFSYLPSQPLHEQWAFFKVAGSIDIVSHADRLRQSACFLATRSAAQPLECATCHDPHRAPPDSSARNLPCQGCHSSTVLSQRLARSPSLGDHGPGGDCTRCHMPSVKERAVPHGTFTDHWIRVVKPEAPVSARRATDELIEAYFDRDRAGADAAVYRGMGQIVYATRAIDGRALGAGAAALHRALAADTTHGEAHFLLGVAYQQLGRNDEAVRALEQSVRIDPNRPERLRALAQAYELSGRAPAAIDSLYRRALALQPALAWIRADFARFLQAQGQQQEAEREYRRALTEQPNLAVAAFNLGTLLAEEGRLRDASATFQRAVDLDPSMAEALSSLIEVRTRGAQVIGVRGLGSPLRSLPVRSRGSRAVGLAFSGATETPGLVFVNVPPRAVVQVLRPDGSLVRSLPAGEGGPLRWDLLTQSGAPVGGGLYRAVVLGRDASGRSTGTQTLNVGLVRQRVE
jgi:tetratricopeptide (TPR) repeat protein